MNKRFKCCKNKDFSNYCCIVCLSMFHPSCIERNEKHKAIVKIGGYKVYCSTDCQLKDEVEKDKLTNYNTEIKQLRKDCLDKDILITRLRRQSHQFEQDVVDVEKNYSDDLTQKTEAISALRKQLDQFEHENSKLLLEIEGCRGVERQIRHELDEMTRINRSMISSIRVLEQEGEVCREELVKVRKELAEILEGSSAVTDNGNRKIENLSGKFLEDWRTPRGAVDEKVKQCDVKKKLLLLCDQTGSKVSSKLRKYLPGYNMQSIIKPHALYEHVIEDVVSLTRQFGKDDCVVVMAGVNNFLGRKYPSFREINSKLKYITHTNVVLTSVSCDPSMKYRGFVCKYNETLKSYAAKLDRYACAKISFLDLSHCNINGLVKRLIRGVSARKKVGDSNLVFVGNYDLSVGLDGDGLLSRKGQETVESTEAIVTGDGSLNGSMDCRACLSVDLGVGVLEDRCRVDNFLERTPVRIKCVN